MTRKKLGNAVVWVIIALLIVGLMGFGTTNFGSGSQSVARVGEAEIDLRTYSRTLRRRLNEISQQQGQNFTLAQAQAAGIDRAILAELMGQAALENEAAELGVSVGDEEVGEQVLQIPAFRNAEGEFDRETYRLALDNAGMSVSEFEDQVRDDTARNILEAAVVGGIEAPQTFIDTLYNWARETRSVTWALFTPDDLSEELPQANDEDLATFHEENAGRFTIPETRVLTYVTLTAEDLAATIDFSDDELRAAYDARIDEFVEPERRLVERLVFNDEEPAAEAKASLDAGEITFEALVEERGLELSDIDMGDVTEDALDDAGAEVFAMEEPGIVGPLPSPFGPAIYRVNAILDARETTFEDARETLRQSLALEEARDIINRSAAEIDDLMVGGATLEEVAEETQMTLGTMDWRPGVTDGIAASEAFQAAAQVTDVGDFPELLDTEDGSLFAVRVDEIRPPELQPLEEVRDQVVAAWQVAEMQRRLIEKAQAAQQSIEGGTAFADAAPEVRQLADVRRDTFVEEAPPGMIDGVFQMAEGDIRVFETAEGAALVRLDTITVPDGSAEDAAQLKDGLAQQVRASIAEDALQMFTNAVQLDAGIEVNQQAINAVHAQFN